jgi:hypothetical protein
MGDHRVQKSYFPFFLLYVDYRFFIFAFADSISVTKVFSRFSRYRFSPQVNSSGQKPQALVSNSVYHAVFNDKADLYIYN